MISFVFKYDSSEPSLGHAILTPYNHGRFAFLIFEEEKHVEELPQQTFTWFTPTVETLEKGVK